MRKANVETESYKVWDFGLVSVWMYKAEKTVFLNGSVMLNLVDFRSEKYDYQAAIVHVEKFVSDIKKATSFAKELERSHE
jgi:hypothetical protein